MADVFKNVVLVPSFFGGVWTALELNPNVLLIKQLATVIETLGMTQASAQFQSGMLLLLTVLTLASLLGTYQLGGGLGLVAWGLLYGGGATIIGTPAFGTILLLCGFGLALLATDPDERQAPAPTMPR